MKKLILFVIALFVMLSIAAAPAPQTFAGDLPPALPSSIYGHAPAQGTVAVFIGARQVASARTTLYQGRPVYSIDVPMDGAQANTLATLKFNGIQVGTVRLASGTNQLIDLKLPRFWWWR